MRLSGHCLGAVFIALTVLVSTALGQSFGFNPSANNPTPELPAVQKYLNQQISTLMGTDREAVVAARDALLAPIGGSANASPAFKDAYISEVAARIGKAVASNDSHVRINAAIVIQKITEQTLTSRFAPQIALLIDDNSPAITVWGLKAAAPIVPQLANDPNAQAVFVKLQASIIVHRDNVAVVEEAYNALTAALKNPKAVSDLGNQKSKVVGRIVQELQWLIETRLSSESSGARPAPLIEERDGLRFIVQNVWRELSDAQKARTAQLFVDQLSTSLARVAAGRNPMANQQAKDLANEHNELIRRTGRLLQVLAQVSGQSALTKPATDISRLNPSIPPDQYAGAIKAVNDALTSLFPPPATAPAQ